MSGQDNVPVAQRLEALRLASALLACPVCARRGTPDVPLALSGRTLRCTGGHVFDVARQGYVNLAGAAQPRNADTAQMLAARDRFLGSGVHEPLRAAIVEACGATPSSLVEAGAGTGWYLAGAVAAFPRATALALDVSVPALRRSAARGLASVVADSWVGLPLRSGSVDALLCVFAPRNAGEFARVLSPVGRLVVAAPTTAHLAGLRTRLGLLDVAGDKAERLTGQMCEAGLVPAGRRLVEFDALCTPEQLRDLVAMGPNAFHEHPEPGGPGVITVSVLVSVFTRTTRTSP
ncbi:putative RNA methyltransferase [Propionibacterium australiense]|uniref:rRNA (Guanine-N1-)-methyltransferase A, predicted n=1 Tax=Propionibacterium australiense TaxID=119981 RepID=A0A383S3Z4_9ACTN|nr:hypothetical protein [Propionibacterium australiense]RLP12437.1 hypothetical protein D9T14_00895 [Propionibacterium australiense]SYZ32748.1 rRNA (guanine-N1-)-methyltransferase A, predicted [Propionibacterium australiense]VEH91422.1 Ribosomal RNA large subunit methyltransferase A [Propionibacterium australiense]